MKRASKGQNDVVDRHNGSATQPTPDEGPIRHTCLRRKRSFRDTKWSRF